MLLYFKDIFKMIGYFQLNNFLLLNSHNLILYLNIVAFFLKIWVYIFIPIIHSVFLMIVG